MKLRIGTLALAVFLLLALALGARLAWVASQLETGAETLALSWRGATLGQVGWPRVPLCDRPAADQADFWLAEVDRILAEREPSAELLMGAAWLLDWPGSSDPYNDLSPAGLAQGGPFPPDGDGSSGYRAEEFEAKCSARCLELATAATEREPGNVGLWRMRALLLFRFSYGNDTQDARRADWRAQLDECARHDPDNALYDYLAARHLWRGNLQSDWHGDDEVFWVEDPERFAEGTARLEQGLKKKHFTVGATAIPGAAELVRHARLPHV
ncbi:MAG: hypothetical protein HQ581_00465, partial [Planctomycetes bacterium]|nr:hypothetical protein [Planctomycetota bacterium]